jgi:hypothetical protein
VALNVGPPLGAIGKRAEAAVAAYLRRDALTDRGRRERLLLKARKVGVRVGVDEAWRDDQAGGGEVSVGDRSGQVTDGRDLATGDADVADIRDTAGAVDDRPAPKNQLERLVSLPLAYLLACQITAMSFC